jgi:phosphoglycerol transferase MdoB-like AlkP superfamily enzyme
MCFCNSHLCLNSYEHYILIFGIMSNGQTGFFQGVLSLPTALVCWCNYQALTITLHYVGLIFPVEWHSPSYLISILYSKCLIVFLFFLRHFKNNDQKWECRWKVSCLSKPQFIFKGFILALFRAAWLTTPYTKEWAAIEANHAELKGAVEGKTFHAGFRCKR